MNELEQTVTTSAISLSAGLIPLVSDYTNGESLEVLAIKYGISEVEVSEFLNRKEVRTYIATTLQNHGYVAKKKRIDLLNRIVDQKILEAEENELSLSNKDLLDVIKLLKEEDTEITKTNQIEESDTSKGVYIQLINSLKAD